MTHAFHQVEYDLALITEHCDEVLSVKSGRRKTFKIGESIGRCDVILSSHLSEEQ